MKNKKLSDDKNDKMNFKKACEHIAASRLLQRKDGKPVTANDIWYYSSTGELYMIFEWYEAACQILGKRATGDTRPIKKAARK